MTRSGFKLTTSRTPQPTCTTPVTTRLRWTNSWQFSRTWETDRKTVDFPICSLWRDSPSAVRWAVREMSSASCRLLFPSSVFSTSSSVCRQGAPAVTPPVTHHTQPLHPLICMVKNWRFTRKLELGQYHTFFDTLRHQNCVRYSILALQV